MRISVVFLLLTLNLVGGVPVELPNSLSMAAINSNILDQNISRRSLSNGLYVTILEKHRHTSA